MTTIAYRGYEITPGPAYTRWDRWQFVSENYDGPEDRRAGFGESVEDCQHDIDELIAEGYA